MKKRKKPVVFTRDQVRELYERNSTAFIRMVEETRLALHDQRDIILTFPIVFQTTREAIRQLSREVRELDRHVVELIGIVKTRGETRRKNAAGSKQRGH